MKNQLFALCLVCSPVIVLAGEPNITALTVSDGCPRSVADPSQPSMTYARYLVHVSLLDNGIVKKEHTYTIGSTVGVLSRLSNQNAMTYAGEIKHIPNVPDSIYPGSVSVGQLVNLCSQRYDSATNTMLATIEYKDDALTGWNESKNGDSSYKQPIITTFAKSNQTVVLHFGDPPAVLDTGNPNYVVTIALASSVEILRTQFP